MKPSNSSGPEVITPSQKQWKFIQMEQLQEIVKEEMRKKELRKLVNNTKGGSAPSTPESVLPTSLKRKVRDMFLVDDRNIYGNCNGGSIARSQLYSRLMEPPIQFSYFNELILSGKSLYKKLIFC
jgi:hypothetical protein